MERYFLIFYRAKLISNGQQIGHLTHVSSYGRYPNCKNIIEWLKQKNPNSENIVITNLIEVNESDFKDWSA